MTIYPEVDIHDDTRYCQIRTHVRLKGEDGKYYIKMVDASYHFGRGEDGNQHVLDSVLRKFQYNVHIIMTLYKVREGDPYLKLDPNQEDEQTRIEKKYLIKS